MVGTSNQSVPGQHGHWPVGGLEGSSHVDRRFDTCLQNRRSKELEIRRNHQIFFKIAIYLFQISSNVEGECDCDCVCHSMLEVFLNPRASFLVGFWKELPGGAHQRGLLWLLGKPWIKCFGSLVFCNTCKYHPARNVFGRGIECQPCG